MGSIARILSNTFYLTLDWVALTLGGYIYWIVMGKMLPVADIGRFSTILNTAIFLVGISSLGMNIAVTRIFPEYQIKNKLREISSAISWTLKATTLVTVAIGVVIILASYIFGSYGTFTLNNVIFIALVMVLTNLVYMTAAYLFGLQRMRELFLSDAFMSASKVLMTVPLIFLGFGYFGPVYGFLLAAMVTFLFRWKRLPKGGTSVDKRKIWFYSIPVLVSSVGIMVLNQGSIVMLSVLSTATNVGLFSILFYITSPIRMVPQLISQGMFPTTSQKWATNEIQQIKKIISRSIKYSLFLIMPMIISLSIFSKEVILLLVTTDYIPISGMFFHMSLAYLFLGMSTIFSNMLYSAGEVKSFRNANLIAGSINIVVGASAIILFGVLGAVIGFLAASFSMLLISFYFLRNKISFEVGKHNIVKLIAASAIFVLVSGIISMAETPIAWILAIVVGLLFFAGSLLLLRFFDSLDMRIIEELEGRSTGNKRKLIKNVKNFLARFIK